MERVDIDRIRHIKLYCEGIANTIKRFGDSYEIFTSDKDFYLSVSMSIMQIGELSSGLSDEFKNATRTHMPWGLIKGMRNHFAHGYAMMKIIEIWETASEDIPNLLSFCNRIIAENT